MIKRLVIISMLCSLLSTVNGMSSYYGPPEKKIDLKLSKSNNRDDLAMTGTYMILGGALYCTALLLEGNESYASAYKTSGNTVYRTVPPFYKQTPKNLYFLGGLGFICVGITLKINNSDHKRK